jgi:GNAT superfamily N-acetyltransferase
MDQEYHIVSVEKPDDAVWEAVGGGLESFNVQKAGDTQWKRVCLVLYAPDQSVAGGLIGEVFWNWFYISLLFVKEPLRGQGYGQKLLIMAEEEARQHGAKHAYLDTFSFQAPDFYLKLGYTVFGELDDFPPGHQRYYLAKDL